MKILKMKIFLISIPLLITACGSAKAVSGDTIQKTTTPVDTVVVPAKPAKDPAASVKSLAFVQKVSDQQVYTKNIVGDMSLHIKAPSKEITLPASLHMRKDEVIRIQILVPLLGSEVARLEFTPDHVLIVDRIHKEYIEASYQEVDFLKKQGLSFYSLQAMFWNQLFIPGVKKVEESDLKKFTANLESKDATIPVSLKQGSMNFQWNADKATGRILSSLITLNTKATGLSKLKWDYSDFKSVGVKSFPASQSFNLQTTVNRKKQDVNITIKMDEVKTSDKWDVKTTLSDRYKKVPPTEVLGRIINM